MLSKGLNRYEYYSRINDYTFAKLGYNTPYVSIFDIDIRINRKC